MYTLENGRVVENLTYEGIENGWMVSPFFWWNGRKVREVYNAETEEIKRIDIKGEEILSCLT